MAIAVCSLFYWKQYGLRSDLSFTKFYGKKLGEPCIQVHVITRFAIKGLHYILEATFYTPVLKKRDVLWHGAVSQSVHLSVNDLHDSSWKCMLGQGKVSHTRMIVTPSLVSELCPFENRKKNLVITISQ